MINFTDIIKGKFLEEFSAISVQEMLVAIALSFALSLFIVFIYRITYAGVSFSPSFAGCLIMISMVTTVVILVITSNVVLSLGMVGALSIVRFRTAVKDARDTAFLFWAIATGIICGAGYVTMSVLSALLLGLLFVLVHAFGTKQKSDSYMVVAHFEDGAEVEEKLSALPGYRMKNKTMSGAATQIVVEVRLDDAGMAVLEQLRQCALTERHARALLKLPTDVQKLKTIQLIVRQGLSVAKTEQYIESLLAQKQPKVPRANVGAFLNNLNQSLARIQLSGIPAVSERRETDSQIVLTITIPK